MDLISEYLLPLFIIYSYFIFLQGCIMPWQVPNVPTLFTPFVLCYYYYNYCCWDGRVDMVPDCHSKWIVDWLTCLEKGWIDWSDSTLCSLASNKHFHWSQTREHHLVDSICNVCSYSFHLWRVCCHGNDVEGWKQE